VTNRCGFAVLVHAVLPGAQHDLSLLRSTLPDIEQLIMAHPGQPCEILADKAYTGVHKLPHVHKIAQGGGK
jgi:hypothetical protein